MRRWTAGIVCVAGALLGAAPSASAEVLQSASTVPRECAAELASAGADRASWTSPRQGFLTARLNGGPRGDWELAAFRRGEPVGASTAMGSDERLDLFAERGQR